MKQPENLICLHQINCRNPFTEVFCNRSWVFIDEEQYINSEKRKNNIYIHVGTVTQNSLMAPPKGECPKIIPLSHD